MSKSPEFSPAVIEQAARTVFDTVNECPSQSPATSSIAARVGRPAAAFCRCVDQGETGQRRPLSEIIHQQFSGLLAQIERRAVSHLGR